MKVNKTDKSIGNLNMLRNAYNLDPVYQREGDIWSTEKKQLFIDSILCGYDIPKLYVHDISTDSESIFDVVDGKQRLTAIYSFLDGNFGIKVTPLEKDIEPHLRNNRPEPGSKFSEFNPEWQEYFRSTQLAIVQITNVSNSSAEGEIGEMFLRLNNGATLNAAEQRNGIPSNMNILIREIANNEIFFKEKLPTLRRFSDLDLAAKFILLVKTLQDTQNNICSLMKKELDQLVENNKEISNALRNKIKTELQRDLKYMNKVFEDGDFLLKGAGNRPIYFTFIKELRSLYYIDSPKKIRMFLQDFEEKRIENGNRADDHRDNQLTNYTFNLTSGVSGIESLKENKNILISRYLEKYPETPFKDPTRLFTQEERILIWIRGNKKCELCNISLELPQMDADHNREWSLGGQTTLDNGRCLCQICNRSRPNATQT
tara:strand:- start:132 stop:1421 length:1290 start_codon:yes stop_codon:yes gene_type:complete